jgi:multidrug efflux system membrane fusion protein
MKIVLSILVVLAALAGGLYALAPRLGVSLPGEPARASPDEAVTRSGGHAAGEGGKSEASKVEGPKGGASKGGAAGGRGAVPVVAVTSRRGDMGIYLTGLGNVTPFNTVNVKPRVDGEIMKVAFAEGDVVHEGDLLVDIDPRPFQVQLEQAEGQLERDAAQLKNARLDLERYRSAIEAVTQQQIDTAQATVSLYEGALKQDQSQIDSAKLNLVYAHITSPITGRVGLRLVDQGNMVHASDPGYLCVIAQVEPIAVLFYLPEDDLAQIIGRPNRGKGLPVEAFDRDLKRSIASGELLTIDNQIDPTTGTIRCKAVFKNTDGALFPNQFVNARLRVDTLRDVVLVPSAAVQRSPTSTFSYVVKSDDTVEMREIAVGPTEGPDTAIPSGLEAGERVVVEGVDKLQQGAKVTVHMQDEAPKAGAEARSRETKGKEAPPVAEGAVPREGAKGAAPKPAGAPR